MSAPDAPALAGEVTAVTSTRMSLLLTEPVPGTAFVVAEGTGNPSSVSVWAYFYGPDSEAAAETSQTAWGEWLADRV